MYGNQFGHYLNINGLKTGTNFGHCDLEPRTNSASVISRWIEKLKKTERLCDQYSVIILFCKRRVPKVYRNYNR